jgi:hypothetical protein
MDKPADDVAQPAGVVTLPIGFGITVTLPRAGLPLADFQAALAHAHMRRTLLLGAEPLLLPSLYRADWWDLCIEDVWRPGLLAVHGSVGDPLAPAVLLDFPLECRRTELFDPPTAIGMVRFRPTGVIYFLRQFVPVLPEEPPPPAETYPQPSLDLPKLAVPRRRASPVTDQAQEIVTKLIEADKLQRPMPKHSAWRQTQRYTDLMTLAKSERAQHRALIAALKDADFDTTD